jgi:hypothetical protein
MVGFDDSQPCCYQEGRKSSDDALGIFVKQVIKRLELLLELEISAEGRVRETAALVKVRWPLRWAMLRVAGSQGEMVRHAGRLSSSPLLDNEGSGRVSLG